MNEPRGMWPAALPWNTTVTLADVWHKPSRAERMKAERAELRQKADEAAEITRRLNRPKIVPSGKIAYAGRGK